MRVRIFFITDIHGSTQCFKKFVNAASVYNANVLILGGDIAGKTLIPIIKKDGYFEILNEGKRFDLRKLNELKKEFEKKGQYYLIGSEEEILKIKSSEGMLNLTFESLISERLREWIGFAEQKLKGKEVECYISLGNDDYPSLEREINQSSFVINPEERVVRIKGKYEMLTLGYSNITPWKSPRELTEDELQEKIENLALHLSDPSTSIFNLHVPPVNTELDKAPEINQSFEYKRSVMGVKIYHAGSKAVLDSIQKYQPLLGLHGHIHESRGYVKIGRTLCINPGSEYETGILKGALIELEDNSVRDFVLTSG